MTDILQHPYTQAFARALLHFLWQGAAIGIIGYLLLRGLRSSATARHTTGVVLLAAMLAAPAVTTWYFVREAPASGETTVAMAPASVVDPTSTGPRVSSPVGPASATTQSTTEPTVSPVVVLAIWLTGVLALSIRLVGGWIVARRMARRAIQLASPDVQSLARRVAGRLALDRVVRIVESSRITVPVMVGWIKPVVILPTAALAGLTPLQLEALLAHELAHIRRHDYLVNLLQSAVETVLFYHPAVWWVSAEVRAAREQCCDDLAVGICDRLVYATALAELAAMANVPRLALAAADGSLVERIRRVLGQPVKPSDQRTAWLPIVIITVVLGGLMPAAFTAAATDQSGVAAGVPGGVSGGVPGGVSGGVSGGVAAGVPGRVSEGLTSVNPQPVQAQATAAQSENPLTAKVDMLIQLREHAQRDLENARLMVEIGTLAGVEVPDAQATLARVQEEVIARETPRDNQKALTESETALVKQKFAEALRKLEDVETRFKYGVATLKSVDEALLAAMEVAKKAAGDQTAKVSPEQSGAEQAAQVEKELATLRRQMEETQKNLARTKELLANGLASQAQMDTLLAQLVGLQKKLDGYAQDSSRNAELEQKLATEKQMKAEYAKLSVADAELKLIRTKELADKNLVSEQQVGEAEAALRRARAEFESQGPYQKSIEARPEVPLSASAASLRDRILREGATMSDDALIGVLKDAAKLSGDTDRAEVLLAFARQQTMTLDMATLYVAAAGGIKSDEERARVFRQPVRLRQGKGK
jgi:beta-lactamase regulating signal transducer with metallopeptidase domain